MNTALPTALTIEGATVVITHRVPHEKRDQYEHWLEEIAPLCKSFPGHLDWHIIRPISGLSENFTVIIRFDTTANLQAWMASPERSRLIAEASSMLTAGDNFFINSGLDFWFTPEQAKAKIPVRWKQALVTWSAIFPLVLIVPVVILPILRGTGIPANHYSDTLFVTATVVALMIYLVMPRYTKLIYRWLFK